MEALSPQQSQLIPPNNVPTKETGTAATTIPAIAGEGASEDTLKNSRWQEYVGQIAVEGCIGPIVISTENTTLTDFGVEEKIVRIKITDGNIVQMIDRRITDPAPSRFTQGKCIIEYGLDVARARKEDKLYPSVIWRVVDEEAQIRKNGVAQKPSKLQINDSRSIDNRRAFVESMFELLKI